MKCNKLSPTAQYPTGPLLPGHCPQVAGGGDNIWTWKVAVNMLNK
jgi:hypothetical protein